MKIAALIIRVLLGLAFVASGVSVLLMKSLPVMPGPAGAFMGALFSSHYLYAVKVFEIAGGVLLLSGRFAPLGLTLVGPVIVNIMFYDIFLDHTALPVGIVVSVLALFLLYYYRTAFAGIVARHSPGS